MASERDFELLDEYIRHKLNGADHAAFEQKLAADPALKSEFQLQQGIAEGLRQARASELKTMLNNIPVPAATGGTSTLAKLGIGIGAVVVVGLGIYYFTQHEEQPAVSVEPQQVVTETKPEASAPAPENQPQQNEQTAAVEPETKNVVEPKQSTSKQTKKTKPQEKPVEKPVINAFDPSEETENDESVTAAADKIESAEKSADGITIPVETISNNKKYSFHYQFKDDKLVLYGVDKNLYYIMEFFSDNKPTRFLFYKDNYYLLEDQNDKIKPLHAINDPALLKKLRASRGN